MQARVRGAAGSQVLQGLLCLLRVAVVPVGAGPLAEGLLAVRAPLSGGQALLVPGEEAKPAGEGGRERPPSGHGASNAVRAGHRAANAGGGKPRRGRKELVGPRVRG